MHFTPAGSKPLLQRLGLAALLLSGTACGQDTNVRATAPPVTYQHISRYLPPMSLHIVTIALDDPRVSVHVSRGGADPDGDGPWLTTLLPTSEIAEREHFDIAINGDFFSAQATQDIEGANTGYVKGKFASPVGAAMTEGKLWHRSPSRHPFLEIIAPHTARVAGDQPGDTIDPAAREVIGGSNVLVRDGRAIPATTTFALDRHPRTVVGIAKGGHQLILLVVDGRQPQLSIGMTFAELSEEMIRLGSDSAINLDGGGSTTLVYRNPKTKSLEVLNSPSDWKERSVADVLGVSVKAPLPDPK
jgi:exopolysaccharide biosynthesis protein